MSGMWRHWARRRRLVGLTYLTLAAIALAVAVLIWSVGASVMAGLLTLAVVALLVLAVIEFAYARKYSRLAG